MCTSVVSDGDDEASDIGGCGIAMDPMVIATIAVKTERRWGQEEQVVMENRTEKKQLLLLRYEMKRQTLSSM